MSYEGRVALITGSSSGIGASTARLFAKRGYKVVVTGRNEQRVKQVADECSKLSPCGSEALPIICDLGNIESISGIIDKISKHFGRLDVLVNSAGDFYKTNAADLNSLDNYRKTMAINCESVIRITMEAIPLLEKSPTGNIVFVSSVASTKPSGNAYAYRMSKAAISSYAKCLAIDVAGKIRVNIVSPGPVATPIFDRAGISRERLDKEVGAGTLIGRVGKSDEIASTIYFLASDEASYLVGAEIFVDGGYLCKHPVPNKYSNSNNDS